MQQIHFAADVWLWVKIFSREGQLQSPMSTVSIPLSLPVKIMGQESNITITQNEDGYFMNLAVKVELPLKDLVDSLMKCGERIPDEIYSLTPQKEVSPTTTTPETVSTPVVPSPGCSVTGFMDDAASSDRVNPGQSYCSLPFSRIDAPFKSKGRWRSNSATYFLKEKPVVGKKQLSPNAPVFTPCMSLSASHVPAASPYSQCSLAGSDAVWELPGLPSPLIEASHEPMFAACEPSTPPAMVQSILQRGISNQCRQM